MTWDLDLGSDRYLTWIWGAEHNQNFHPDVEVLDNHRPIGALLVHGWRCVSAIPFDLFEAPPASYRWAVDAWSPLTLAQPLRCHCGVLGMIREGQWLPI